MQEQLPLKFGEFGNTHFADFQSQIYKAFESDIHPNDNIYYEKLDYDYDEGIYDDADYDDTQTFEEGRIKFEKKNAESSKNVF